MRDVVSDTLSPVLKVRDLPLHVEVCIRRDA